MIAASAPVFQSVFASVGTTAEAWPDSVDGPQVLRLLSWGSPGRVGFVELDALKADGSRVRRKFRRLGPGCRRLLEAATNVRTLVVADRYSWWEWTESMHVGSHGWSQTVHWRSPSPDWPTPSDLSRLMADPNVTMVHQRWAGDFRWQNEERLQSFIYAGRPYLHIPRLPVEAELQLQFAGAAEKIDISRNPGRSVSVYGMSVESC